MYFKNVPDIGDLTTEKILFEFDKIPIVFVCQDETNERFLCLCTDCIIDYSWMITRITRNILINLIKNKFTILDAFKQSNNNVYIVEKRNHQYTYSKYKFSDIPTDELPDESEKLDNPFLEDYLVGLELEEIIASINWPETTPERNFSIKSKEDPRIEVFSISTTKKNNSSEFSHKQHLYYHPDMTIISYSCEAALKKKQYIRSNSWENKYKSYMIES